MSCLAVTALVETDRYISPDYPKELDLNTPSRQLSKNLNRKMDRAALKRHGAHSPGLTYRDHFMDIQGHNIGDT